MRAQMWMVAAVVVLGGCAEASFSTHARDNSVPDIQRALAEVAPAPSSAGASRAFLVTAAPDKKLIGYDLAAGKILWQVSADVRSRVAVAPGGASGLIAYREGERAIAARDSQSGQVVFTVSLKPSERFMGLALDGERLYYVVQADGAERVSSLVAVDRTGHELWRMPATGTLGAPAALGGVVAVPLRTQSISLLDGKTGRELARVRNTDEEITFVRALSDGFYYGGAHGVYRLDAKSASGDAKGSTFFAARFGSDQVRTFYYWNGYQAAQTDYTAFDRNRLLWRAGPSGFQDGATYLQSYRYFFAFDAASGRLRWAWSHPRTDVVSAEAEGPSLVYASTDGEVGALDARSGAVRLSYKTGLRLRGASFDAVGFAGGSAGQAAVDPAGVLSTLDQIVWDRDARFTAVKVFAVNAIGELAGKEASAALLKVVLAEHGVPPSVQKRAGEALVARKDASAIDLYLDALKVHADWLADRRPRGVAVLARALAGLGAKQAAPELAAHLADPATPQPALRELASGLAELGGAEAVRALGDYLLTYRADPMFLSDPSSLTIAGEGLLQQGGAEGRRTVTFVAGEPRTLPAVASYLQKALADTAPKPKAKAKAKSAAPASPAKSEAQ
ncbi:MAG TPA: PQQ-binding-like beta-propeller repeat protein [Polyangia bacterium]